MPTPEAPQMKTFLPSAKYLRTSSICLVWIVVTVGSFFCGTTLMKESIDDLTNQAIDLVLENDALHKRIVEPLKRKIVPYVACSLMTNLTMIIILVYLARRLHLLQSPGV